MAPHSVRILYPDSGIGLANDALILSGALERLGLRCRVCALPADFRGSLPLRAAGRLARRGAEDNRAARTYNRVVSFTRRLHGDVADLNIFLQRVYHTLLPGARRNVLIPNPEWLRPQWLWQLRLVDKVWCKTQHAVALLSPHAPNCVYIGFTSLDRRLPSAASDAGWLHIASSGVQKGTDAVLQAWWRHPHWPRLTVLQHRLQPLGSSTENVRYIARRLSEAEVVSLLNANAFHLCPSQSEGFGHTIVEGLGCKALVLATDAPPMNELVNESRGVLVAAGNGQPQRLGVRYTVDAEAVSEAVERTLALQRSDIADRRQAARAWFEANAARFDRQLQDALELL